MLRLVTEQHETPQQTMAAQVRELANLIESGKIELRHGVITAVVDGAVSYAPIGAISLIETVGLLELASRKVERDMLR
jgi:hypothetical protein